MFTRPYTTDYYAEVVPVATPAIVKALRARDTHNRPKKPLHKEFLRQQVREGKFLPTNTGVAVAKSGHLLDWGHRLEVLEEENFPPIPLLIVWNVPDEAVAYIDNPIAGAARTVPDILKLMLDIEVSQKMVAMLNVSLRMGRPYWSPEKVPMDQIVEALMDKEASLNAILALPKAKTLAAPILAAAMDVYHKTKDDRVLTFVSRVVDGALIGPGHPAYALREWLNGERNNAGGSSAQKERYEKTFAAVVAALEDRTLKKVYARAPKNVRLPGDTT